jgi:peptide deformylase
VAVLPVRIYGDPVLRAKTQPVPAVDDPLRRLIADMHETMQHYRGVGLAANQVGDLRRVLVIDAPLEGQRRVQMALVNPTLHEPSGSESAEEGCLSIPGVWEDVKRATRVRVKALDEHGRPLDFLADDYVARIIQHEVDHLDGVLFVDRLSPLKRQLLRKTLQSLARGEMPEGYEHYGQTGEGAAG